jgi:dTDP-4-dehydrorhamnose reductase
MRVFVTGAAGRLGSSLVERLRTQGYDVIGVDAAEADVAHFDAIRALVRAARPDIVIHAAAWTDVDGCAREPERAIAINGFGAQNVALAAAESGAAMVYVSTNEVFDGRLNRAYYEYDRPNPSNAYGYSKWIGEQATMSLNPRHYVVRTAWLFAHGGKNFIQSILNAARAGKTLRVVANEVANPTYNDDLADAICRLILTERFGIYHLVNEGATSRYQFAEYALQRAGLGDVPLEKISSFEWQRPSTPPPYCALNNLAGPTVGVVLRPWQSAVDAFLAQEGLLGESPAPGGAQN